MISRVGIALEVFVLNKLLVSYQIVYVFSKINHYTNDTCRFEKETKEGNTRSHSCPYLRRTRV